MTLRMKHRRQRKHDSMACPESVRRILQLLREALPDIVPKDDKNLKKMLYAVRHTTRYSATDTYRGRPSKWKRDDLLKVSSHLTTILQREGASISLSSFIDHYLRILSFPEDVVAALREGKINLFEGEQLARIKAGRNNLTAEEAKNIRSELLKAHLQAKLSGRRLQQRVNETLEHKDKTVNEVRQSELREEISLLEDFDPHDTSHLFWEEIKMLGFAFREIKREAVTDELLEELLKASGPLWAIISKIQQQANVECRGKLRV